MKPTVILCMAGLYRRFREAGYTTPKFLLPAGDRTILQWVIEELAPDRVLLIANERDREHEAAVLDAVAAAGVSEAALSFVGDTSGQAETAAIGARLAEQRGWTGPLLFHNVDTIVSGRDLSRIAARLGEVAGWIDVFDHDSPAYSYVRLEGDRVTEIAEKVVISRHATTGLYGFSSPATYLQAASATTDRSKNEFYVSDVYRTLLRQGRPVVADPGGEHQQTLILGTPAEYEAWLAERA